MPAHRLRPPLRAAALVLALGAVAPRTLAAQLASPDTTPAPARVADAARPAAPAAPSLPGLTVSARDAEREAAAAARWAGISPETANEPPVRLPLGRASQGPGVLRVQVLLDRALFSPGMIDGRWGRNTEQAVTWLQRREGLAATGQVDSATLARIEALAGGAAAVVRPHVLSEAEARGPFVAIPSDIYQHAKLPCSCYQSLSEKLSETFHATPELLRKLNPGMRLDSLRAGDTLFVPAIRSPEARARGEVREIVVSGSGNYLHALDASGRILYHFPTTLGSSFDPSPAGDFVVRAVSDDPWWHYQPGILAHVPDDRPNAMIPPGPNSAVGKVWISLSVPRYGIHGTRSPETIGYATSAGCVRLTNWDVAFLSRRITPGVPVRFRGTRPEPRPAAPAPAARPDSARRAPAAAPVRPDSARPDSLAPPAPAPAAPTPPVVPDSARPAAPASPRA